LGLVSKFFGVSMEISHDKITYPLTLGHADITIEFLGRDLGQVGGYTWEISKKTIVGKSGVGRTTQNERTATAAVKAQHEYVRSADNYKDDDRDNISAGLPPWPRHQGLHWWSYQHEVDAVAWPIRSACLLHCPN